MSTPDSTPTAMDLLVSQTGLSRDALIDATVVAALSPGWTPAGEALAKPVIVPYAVVPVLEVEEEDEEPAPAPVEAPPADVPAPEPAPAEPTPAAVPIETVPPPAAPAPDPQQTVTVT